MHMRTGNGNGGARQAPVWCANVLMLALALIERRGKGGVARASLGMQWAEEIEAEIEREVEGEWDGAGDGAKAGDGTKISMCTRACAGGTSVGIDGGGDALAPARVHPDVLLICPRRLPGSPTPARSPSPPPRSEITACLQLWHVAFWLSAGLRTEKNRKTIL
jgi:hypothetical protein